LSFRALFLFPCQSPLTSYRWTTSICRMTSDSILGTCDLSADNRKTSLVHTFVPASNNTRHYELDSYSLIQQNFAIYRGSFIELVGSAVIPDTSVESCAALCTRDPACLALMAGNGARSGTCILSQLNRVLAGADYQQG